MAMALHEIKYRTFANGNASQSPSRLSSLTKSIVVAVACLLIVGGVVSASYSWQNNKLAAPMSARASIRPTLSINARPVSTACRGIQTRLERATKVKAMDIEQQKERAKEMIKYYRIKGLERTESNRQVFGWTPNNELLNGRWVMMGLFLGLLTEYATGVNFIDQIKIMLSYTGVIDLE
mmetsp:Transcript_20029/g.29995  ORF Transcript_20029/g.29995 Transcript_20029/m.29995 type:complete len:179 (-) Transcript_20029:105-641(-)|eukprot:CAMPEP_0167766458 /NCGR_PEP_ID=MMETSP0110_2-20121227/15362_1 /TAXON_ID=629695 /ORGANISM="Gymnochlora sp., Strain CCMP2014" /LENGTH=178 /DNA_ID=CAMNT_0007654501 /DNA_START=22 /DNA_END=558 /DNA_ORIENTATION=-